MDVSHPHDYTRVMASSHTNFSFFPFPSPDDTGFFGGTIALPSFKAAFGTKGMLFPLGLTPGAKI